MSSKNKDCHDEYISLSAKIWLTAKHHFKNILKEKKYDLTFEQILVLYILDETEGMNLGAVAEKADRERTTISRMVDGLEKRNLVVRVPDKVDKRQKLLYLTNLGRSRIAETDQLVPDFFERMYVGIDKQEIEKAIETHKKILANLMKI